MRELLKIAVGVEAERTETRRKLVRAEDEHGQGGPAAGQGVGGGLGPQRQVLCVIKGKPIFLKIADQDRVIK